MNITIQVNVPPYTNEDLDTAMHLADACLKKGHKVSMFLFADSVLAADKQVKPMRIDRNIPVKIQELASKGVAINICGLCAEYRGLTQGTNVDGSVFSGVPEMASLVFTSDRYVSLMP
ncbi:MAG TPA: DsrE family protein [Candidatus Deferrimicrobium sp.]|nr:DsrE family protein [Candidatus Deferrimicrobium sp.]